MDTYKAIEEEVKVVTGVVKYTSEQLNKAGQEQIKIMKCFEQLIEDALVNVDSKRREQLTNVVEHFQAIAQDTSEVGRTVEVIGKALSMNYDTEKANIVKALAEAMAKLDKIQRTSLPALRKEIVNATNAVNMDLTKSKIILGFAISAAILGVAAAMAVCTFGIGLVVGCPVLCGCLATMGLQTAAATYTVGISVSIIGLGVVALAAPRAHSAKLAMEQLDTITNIYDALSEEIQKLTQSIIPVHSALVSTLKHSELKLDMAKQAKGLEDSGRGLAEQSEASLKKLAELQHQITTAKEHCVIL